MVQRPSDTCHVEGSFQSAGGVPHSAWGSQEGLHRGEDISILS